MPGDVGLVAKVLSEVFGFAVDPDGLEQMKIEHRIEVIHAGVVIARKQRDTDRLDILFAEYRELSRHTGP